MKRSAKNIMVQGTMSNVGKSIITAAFCRIFTQDGFVTAPFKSQNMALNSYVTPNGLEIGRAQAMQAEAADKDADVRMNPILLKPMGDTTSQVIIKGEPYKNMKASDYYKAKKKFIPYVMESYESLASENEVIVIEGAGSPAEINLNDNDLVNMGLAKMVNAPVILVADIDRGGVFATLYGTAALLPEYKNYFKGAVINKFRGDESLIKPSLRSFGDKLGFPVIGTIPLVDLDIDDEDSLSCQFNKNKAENSDIDIAVIKLPHISNFTDFKVFLSFEGVSVRYVSEKGCLEGADVVIIPGTKNTLDDLRFLKKAGIFDDLKDFALSDKPLIGICGGYQMMCHEIKDPMGKEGGGFEKGLNFFKADTIFTGDKTRTRVKGYFISITGFYDFLNGLDFEGYEIHMGKTNGQMSGAMKVENGSLTDLLGVFNKNIFGTYVHGVFDDLILASAFINKICLIKNIKLKKAMFNSLKEKKNKEYDKLADVVRHSLDMKKVYDILEKGL